MSTTRLKRLKAVETSFVPRGANRKKKFLVLKEEEMGKLEELIAKMKLKNEAAVAKALEGISPEDVDALKVALKVLQSLGDKISPATIQEVMGLVESPALPAKGYTEDQMKAEKDATAAAVAKAAALEKEVATLKSAPVTEVDGIPVTKEGDPDYEKIDAKIRPIVKSLWAQKKADAEKLAAVKKSLDEERDIRVTKEYVEKASAFKHLPIKKEDLGKAMKSVALAGEESYKAFETVLKAANDIVAKADPTAEFGSSTPGSATDDVDAKIEAGTQAIMKEHKMDKASAMTHFLTATSEGRQLYADKKNQNRTH